MDGKSRLRETHCLKKWVESRGNEPLSYTGSSSNPEKHSLERPHKLRSRLLSKSDVGPRVSSPQSLLNLNTPRTGIYYCRKYCKNMMIWRGSDPSSHPFALHSQTRPLLEWAASPASFGYMDILINAHRLRCSHCFLGTIHSNVHSGLCPLVSSSFLWEDNLFWESALFTLLHTPPAWGAFTPGDLTELKSHLAVVLVSGLNSVGADFFTSIRSLRITWPLRLACRRSWLCWIAKAVRLPPRSTTVGSPKPCTLTTVLKL